jgi:hypothetical protein
MFDPARLVFIDETSTSTNMVRLRGVAGAASDYQSRAAGALEDDHLRGWASQ